MNDRGGRIELEVKSEILPFHFSEPESKRVNEVKEACSGLFSIQHSTNYFSLAFVLPVRS
jgi:hypothetical protein